MSTQTLAIPPTQAVFNKRPFRDLWQRPRIVAVDASELIESRTALACDGGENEKETNHMMYGRRYIALTARWKVLAIGGAALEVQDRTAVVRMLHVDKAWRRRGVGRRLLRGLLRRAGFQFIRDVYVLATAADAGFYALHGFRPVEENTANRFDFGGWNEHSTYDGEYLIMHRHLSSPFVSVPHDGITVKLG